MINLHDADMCFVQEHFKLSKNLYTLKKNFKDFCVFSIPASKTNSNLSKGRPSGGLAIIYRKYLEGIATEIIVPESKRVQGIHLNINNSGYVFVNIYMPTDPQTNNFDDTEVVKTLQDIRYVLNLYDPSVSFVLMGDMNCDFSRNTRFVNILKDFLEEHHLMSVWDKFPVNFTYCHPLHNNERQFSFSTIDHFLVQENFIQNCLDGCVLHLGENLSKHEILYLRINCENFSKVIDSSDTNQNISVKPCWNKATSEQKEAFLMSFSEELSFINVPHEALQCRNLQCTNSQHRTSLDEYGVSLMDSLQSSVNQHIPHSEAYDSQLHTWLELLYQAP